MTRETYKQIIVTDDLIQKINPENKKLSERFIREKSTRSSKTTIKSYSSDSNIFFCWNLLYNDNKLFTDIRKLELSDFFSFTTNELRWGSARNNRMRSFLSSLSSFIEKFYDTEYPSFKNIVLKTIESIPKEARREKPFLQKHKYRIYWIIYLKLIVNRRVGWRWPRIAEAVSANCLDLQPVY
jgi:hypothetical protein